MVADLAKAGLRELAVVDETLRFRPSSAMTPDLLQRLTDLKSEILATYSSSAAPNRTTVIFKVEDGGGEPATGETDYWPLISDQDYRYLTGPRLWPRLCPWCGGRTVHSELCRELRSSWEPLFPFGKYRGRRVSEAPVSYCRWLMQSGMRINDADFRDAVERRARDTGLANKPRFQGRESPQMTTAT